jgi:ParB family chromosome partitioning protein
MTDTLEEISVDQRAVMVPLGQLEESPDNPRSHLGGLEGLAASMRVVGVLQPLVVVPLDETNQRFRILAGHRRRAAAELAGLTCVPAVIRKEWTGDDLAQQVAALIENLHREDLSPLDRARGFERLAEHGLKQKDIAARTGVSQPTVSRTLTLLKVPERVQLWVEVGEFGIEQAARLWALSPEDRDEVLYEENDAREARRLLEAIEEEHKQESEAEAGKKATIAELQKSGVLVFGSARDAWAVTAKPLSELHWIKTPAHRKLGCRAVVVEVERSYRGPRVVVSEWCTKPADHPRPKAALRRGEKQAKDDPELVRHLDALAEANARRHEFMATAVPHILGVLHALVESMQEPTEVAEVLGIEAEHWDDRMKALLAHADTVDKAVHILWLDLVLWQESGEFRTEGWGAPKAMNAFATKNSEAREVLEQLQALGYAPSWVELKRAGLPFEEPERSDEPLASIKVRGKKFAAICIEHGELGVNTTEAYAQARAARHVQEVEHAADSTEATS